VSALGRVSIGVVPIVWNNADLTDLAPEVPPETVLDEIRRLGYQGCQHGRGFPTGTELRSALGARALRLAEVYAALPCTRNGPTSGAFDHGRERLAILADGGGDVLDVALEGSAERDAWAARAADRDAPALSERGWGSLVDLLHRLARETQAAGARLCFHAHTGTWVETPDELDRLVAETEPRLVQLCLDVGHHTVSGGDPAAAIRRYGARIGHVHLKDVDGDVLARLREGRLGGFRDAVRERIFTELGSGIIDLPGVLDALAAVDYGGWLMVEQDTTWLSPSESAAIGNRVLEYALRQLGARRAA
jgi:inosose dehydratase